MKATITISIILLSVLFNSALAQHWLWANSGSGARATAVCSDPNGNSYVIGTVSNPSASFQGINITVKGDNDIFLAKYNAEGGTVWVKSFGGSYSITAIHEDIRLEEARAVAYSAAANAVYISGNYIGSCSLGSVTLTATGNSGNNNSQNFIAKFDVNGNCLWAKNTGNEGNGLMNLTVSADGKIFTCGGTTGTAAFDSFTLSNGTYIARYDDNGICQWLKKTSDDPNIGGSATVIKIFEGDIFIVGIHLQSQKKILARLSPEGNVKWMHLFNKLNLIYGHGLSIDNEGNSYCATYDSYIVIENDTIRAVNPNTGDFFLMKFDPNGNFKWVRQSYAVEGSQIYGTSCDAKGNVYVTGIFSGNASFGNYNISTSSNETNFFLARYDSSGNCLGVQYGETAKGCDLYVDANGSCVMVGWFAGSVSFGSINLSLSMSSNDVGAFIAKIDEVLTTGVKELDKKMAASNALLIYANPSAGKCSIKIPEDFKNEKDLTLYIYDNTGKLLHQFEIANGFENFKLNLDHEAKGIYNAVLSNRNKSYKGNIVLVE